MRSFGRDGASSAVAGPEPVDDGRTAAPAAPSQVELDDVGMTFAAPSGETVAIRSLSGHILDGRFVSVVGPSGCGKTTLLDIVGGLRRPTKGRVTVAGEQVLGPRRDLAMVFQEDSTLHWRTTLQNVSLGLEVAGVPRAEREERARRMIDLVGLAGFEQHRPRQLSGGMKQRVAIARALVMEPRILLMDEPFGFLDQQTRAFLGQELLRIWDETRKSVLFVTHDIQEAIYLSDEVWVLSQRPSTLKERVVIDLPRPRSLEMVGDPQFQEYTRHLWRLLLEESAFALTDPRWT